MRIRRTVWFSLLSGGLALMLTIGSAFAEKTYTIQRGDTLSILAQRFSISLDALVQLNNIADPDKIHVGQVLKLPDDAVLPDDPPADEATPDAPATTEDPAATADDAQARPLTGRELVEQRTRYLEQLREQQAGEQIVSVAKAFSGTPYRWGGLSSRGIDCSGLVVRALGAQGMRVPHRAADLYQMGNPVSYGELQPGDLLFFNTNGRGVSHVGIWVGENNFVHASYSRGVVEDELTGYYSKRLVGARRLH